MPFSNGGNPMTTNTQNSAQLLTEIEVAELLSIRPTTLRRWRWAGRGPSFVKIGTAVRYDPTVLADFIDAGRRTSTSDPGPQAARP